jgi:hypothetical protein
MSLMVVSAATSQVLIDGEEVKGVQSLDYKVKRRQVDVEGVGSAERIGVAYALLNVTGTIRIKSMSKTLDDKLLDPLSAPFNLVAILMRGNQQVKKISFHECCLDDKSFELTAEGVGLTTYNFTATRIKEE